MTDLDIPSRMRSLPRNSAGSPEPWCASLPEAVNKRLCWLCGEKMGAYAAFLLDARQSITRLAEAPPSHRECALFVAQDQSSDYPKPATGPLIVWITRAYLPRPDGRGGTNCLITEPENLFWFFEGRPAPKSMAIEDLEREFAPLRDNAEKEGRRAVAALAIYFSAIRSRVPIAE